MENSADEFEGKAAPAISLPDSSGKKVPLKDYLGKKVLLYFYPKDMTAGCTIEAQLFNKDLKKFGELGTVILGVSTDSCDSHTKFSSKHKLNFLLLSDEKKEAVKKYGVWSEKNFYGKRFFGTKRESFLIDEKGKIIKHYKKVNPLNHAKEVLRNIRSL